LRLFVQRRVLVGCCWRTDCLCRHRRVLAAHTTAIALSASAAGNHCQPRQPCQPQPTPTLTPPTTAALAAALQAALASPRGSVRRGSVRLRSARTLSGQAWCGSARQPTCRGALHGALPGKKTRDEEEDEGGDEDGGTLASVVEERGGAPLSSVVVVVVGVTPLFFNTTSHFPCAVNPSTL
jgi:hypothetical protein